MFTKISHATGIESDVEILFSTPFDYFFPEAARSTPCLLPSDEATAAALMTLGKLMADPGTEADPQTMFDSTIPAIFTYLGQFIDHDITARTDRDGMLSALGKGDPIAPLDPDLVVRTLRNGRRPQLDMDHLFGDAPALVSGARSESQTLYDANFRLKVFEDAAAKRRDVSRDPVSKMAIIADMRNDENLNISQLHCAFQLFYDKIYEAQPTADPSKERYVRARQLTRWAYQYVIVHDYLPTVCDTAVVSDTIANGPRFLGAMSARGGAFMPLEFSTSAFRFAHSMIRPFYQLNAGTKLTLLETLNPAGPAGSTANFPTTGAHLDQLDVSRVIDFEFYAGSGTPAKPVQMARKIDTKIAHDLFTLPLAGRTDDPVLANLARSNLLRAYNLSIPTGQAMCDAFDIDPLTTKEIRVDEDAKIVELFDDTYLDRRTPLWYYVLREAAVQQQGDRLGELGSRLVAETLYSLLRQDNGSFVHNRFDHAVKANGIEVGPGVVISKLTDIFKFAGVATF